MEFSVQFDEKDTVQLDSNLLEIKCKKRRSEQIIVRISPETYSLDYEGKIQIYIKSTTINKHILILFPSVLANIINEYCEDTITLSYTLNVFIARDDNNYYKYNYNIHTVFYCNANGIVGGKKIEFGFQLCTTPPGGSSRTGGWPPVVQRYLDVWMIETQLVCIHRQVFLKKI
jgi:hypothetical protein